MMTNRTMTSRPRRIVVPALAIVFASLFLDAAVRADDPLPASQAAAAMDRQVDWTPAMTIAVEHANRYKALESFARERFAAMSGEEHLPGLSPLASLFDWLFRAEVYADAPLVSIKERGLRIDLTASHAISDEARERIRQTGMMTPRELASADVQRNLERLGTLNTMSRSVGRVRNAELTAAHLSAALSIVPQPGPDKTAAWFPIENLAVNARSELAALGITQVAGISDSARPVPGVPPDQALRIFSAWASLRDAWLSGDAPRFSEKLRFLSEALPALSDPGVYPKESRLRAETAYYRMHKLAWGYWFYVIGAIFGVWAVTTRWKSAWWSTFLALTVAFGFHAFGIYQRWAILGRIPVANMFEALLFGSAIAILLVLVFEFFKRSNILLLAVGCVGFVALVLAHFVVPDGGTLTSVMGILDDIMLRIHTTTIISSYALVFLGGILALVYLFAYYMHAAPARSIIIGLISTGFGLAVVLALLWQYAMHAGHGTFVASPIVSPLFTGLAVASALALIVFLQSRAYWVYPATCVFMLLTCASVALGSFGFAMGIGICLCAGGLLWSGLTWIGDFIQSHQESSSQVALAGAGAVSGAGAPPISSPGEMAQPARSAARCARCGTPVGGKANFCERCGQRVDRAAADHPRPDAARHAGSIAAAASAVGLKRPASPAGAPAWLADIDWVHQIILNTVFITLFVGTILGAIWADYSWGRPWGWDPKEVFALNTWLIYAVLIHVRLIVKQRALWTAWLSITGCLMMVFNWCFVNFFIVGLHSYA